MQFTAMDVEAPEFHPRSLVELLRWRAFNQRDRHAYTFLLDGETEKASLTYYELDRKARAIGGLLQSAQPAGERALLLYPPGLEYIAAFFGCLYAQVIAVPAYPPLMNRNLARLESIAANSQARFALTTATIRASVKRLFAAAPELARLEWMATDDLPEGMEDSWREGAEDGARLAFLQYTSGSTGTPKGVMVSHSNLLHNMAAVCERFHLTPQSQGVAWQPLFHDMGIIGMVLNPLYVGFPMVLMSPLAFLQHPIRWLQAISRYRATFSGAPSFGYDFCLRMIPPEKYESLDLSSWRLAAVGAEPIRQEALERFITAFAPVGFRREAFHPCYGLAEATLIVSGSPGAPQIVTKTLRKSAFEQNRVVDAAAEEEGAQQIVGCGRALRDQQIVVVHPETRRLCSPDEIGEIWVAGPSVAQGYWDQPAETEEVFYARLSSGGQEAYLRTGDLGFLHEEELYITGRLKDLIIIRGLNHYPQDIERTVETSHLGLRPGCGAAFSIEVDGEERLVVAQEMEMGQPGEASEIISAIRQAVAEQHEIAVYAIVLVRYGSIPMTSSGKIQRRECRAQFIAGRLDVLEQWCNRSADERCFPTHLSPPLGHRQPGPAAQRSQTAATIEGWLSARLAQRLNVTPSEVDVLFPFASYGLDSAEAVRLTAELEDWLGLSLPPTLAWDYPNIRSVARHLAASPLSEEYRATTRGDIRQAFPYEPIAIIGMSGRFPMAPNLEAFWRLLREGVDAITEVPLSRWDVDAYFDSDPATPGKMNTRWGGFLDHVDQFDPQFFGISPREAVRIDPQQRLLLEVSWEALENGGLAPHKLAGSPTGVFIGISTNDYARIVLKDPRNADVYDGTGNALSIAANRISYLFDLRGPSIAIDTACSSSLVAFHMACQSLRSGESCLALAGGVNLILSPEPTIKLSHARMLSADGRCRPFDAAANGYVRGEGCGIVVLKRLSGAQADGDRILALVRGTAVNQDGRSNGLTAPNGPAQQAVVRMALEDAALGPSQISYVEAHGTGTALGDPIEFQALQAVLKPGRTATSPRCLVGSVKTNIGHLEAAAGIAGLIKVVLALNHGEIPAHLHLQKVNPHISLEDSPLTVPIQRCAWPAGLERRYAGVSSFGFGGTNAHVIVEERPEPRVTDKNCPERPLQLFTLSARSEHALKELSTRHSNSMSHYPSESLADLCYTANTGRTHFLHRLAVVAESATQLKASLEAYGKGRDAPGVVSARAQINNKPKIVFLFTGQGAQYVGMGEELYRTQPVFRQALDRCAELLRSSLDQPLLSVLYPASGATVPLHETVYTQPALFALEYALAELWRSWGIQPDAVMGHSVGEYVAACVAGVFPVEDGLQLIAARGRLMQALPVKGSMAVVLEDAQRVSALLRFDSERLALAAMNGPESTVISGTDEAVRAALRQLEAEGVAGHLLQTVSHAFHSPLMNPMLDAFEEAASRVQFASPRIPIISNVTGREVNASERMNAHYWRQHTRETVRFAAGIQALATAGDEIFMELGPKATLLRLGQRCLPRTASTWLPSLEPGRSDWQVLLESLSTLYLAGVDIDWDGFDRDYQRHKVALPTYPFERQRYWLEDSEPASLQNEPLTPQSNLRGKTIHPLLGRQLR